MVKKLHQLKKLFLSIEWKIAIKAGIAATMSLMLGVSVATVMQRPDSLISGTWCVVSTFVVLQAHLGGTYRAAMVRLLGVLVGCVTGGLFTTLFGSNPFLLGIGVILTVSVCSLLKLKDSIRIACLSLSVVMILWGVRPSISPWAFSLYRFLDSALGIFVAVVVTHTLWPTEATQKMRVNIARTLHALSTLFRLNLSPAEEKEKSYRLLNRDAKKLLKENRAFLEASKLELLTRTANIEDWGALVVHLEMIFEELPLIKNFQEKNLDKILDKKLANELNSLIDKTDAAFQLLSEMLERLETTSPLGGLRQSLESLNEELSRFRTTRRTREFSFNDVENYFVFFYHLRAIVEELFRLESKIQNLNALEK